MTDRRLNYGLFLIILLLLSALMIVFFEPISLGHDYYFHLRRFNSLIAAISEGTFPAYIDHQAIDGYGYLSNTFYPDVLLIPFALIAQFTSAVTGYKIMIFTFTVLSGMAMYKTSNTIYKNTFAATFSGLAYAFASYRLLDIYFRASLGEAISFTFVPIVFLGLYYIIKGDYRRQWYVLAIGVSLMVFTHMLSMLLMVVTCGILVLIFYKSFMKEPKRMLYLFLAAGVTLILTAYTLYPMLEQMMSNTFYYSKTTWGDIDEFSFGLYRAIWGMTNGLSLSTQIFAPKTGVLLTFGICARLFIKGKSATLRNTDILVIIGLIYIFASTTNFPWHVFPFDQLSVIQFPWRLLEFATFFLALAGGYYLSLGVKSNLRQFVTIALVSVFICLVMKSEASNYEAFFKNRGASMSTDIAPHYIENASLGYSKEYVPIKIPSLNYFVERKDRIDTENQDTKISKFARNEGVTHFDVTINQADKLEIPLIYYKGYEAVIDSQQLAVEESENGLIEIALSQSGHVQVFYAGTTIQKVSFWISIFAFLILGVYVVLLKRKNEAH